MAKGLLQIPRSNKGEASFSRKSTIKITRPMQPGHMETDLLLRGEPLVASVCRDQSVAECGVVRQFPGRVWWL